MCGDVWWLLQQTGTLAPALTANCPKIRSKFVTWWWGSWPDDDDPVNVDLYDADDPEIEDPNDYDDPNDDDPEDVDPK